MAFRWKAHKSSRSNLRRLARCQLRAAIEELSDPFADDADAVHDARLRLKKVRALVRLVRRAVPADFRRENGALRDAARCLSIERDRQAVIESLGKLLAHAEREWGESAGHLRVLQELRDNLLEAQRQETNGSVRDDLLPRVVEELQTADGRLKQWTVVARDDRVVAGFADTYRRARRAMQFVLADATAERLHEWRKQVKYHRYQVRLFQHAWPAMLEVHCDELKRLADLLGDDHDLVLVRQTLEERAAQSGQANVGQLIDLVERRRRELQAEAVPLGQLLFAEKPKHLARRLLQYWCVYRDADHS